MKNVDYPLLQFTDLAGWRNWLKLHHSNHNGFWMIYFKKHTGQSGISYNDALDEALCYGWIDSLIKKIDEDRYARLFTPRKNYGNWSEKNTARVKQLMHSGRMTEAGMAAMDQSLKNGMARKPENLKKDKFPEMPDTFHSALNLEPSAKLHFNNMAPSCRRNYILWISQAKRTETMNKRIAEAISLLKENRKLGLK